MEYMYFTSKTVLYLETQKWNTSAKIEIEGFFLDLYRLRSWSTAHNLQVEVKTIKIALIFASSLC